MEAMWTRFQPLVLEVKQIAEEGELGDPVVLHADLSGDFDIERVFQLLLLSWRRADLMWVKIFPRRIGFWTQSWVEEQSWICECNHLYLTFTSLS